MSEYKRPMPWYMKNGAHEGRYVRDAAENDGLDRLLEKRKENERLDKDAQKLDEPGDEPPSAPIR